MPAACGYQIIFIQKKGDKKMKPQNVLDFEVHKKFTEALKLGRYIITISSCDRKKKRNQLQHYAVYSNFPTDDIVPSMEQVNRLIWGQVNAKGSAAKST